MLATRVRLKSILRPLPSRRGSVLVLGALLMVVILAFAAFTIDIGYISLTRCQLQSAADAAALAGATELAAGLGPGTTPTQTTVASAGRNAAIAIAGANPAGDLQSVYLNSTSDIQFGRRTYDSATQSWQNTLGAQPYNLVQITAVRGRGAADAGDAAVPLFFAKALNQDDVSLSVSANAALLAAVGFRITPGSGPQTTPLLPIAYDEPSWNALLNGTGNDNYSYVPATGGVSNGSDGIREIDLYPYGNQSLTPGNRGTVDIGNPNNSTADLSRQIRNGVNATDLAYFGGSISLNEGNLSLNGDTGISAGIKDDLTAIIGQPRVIPIFRSVTGPGNNAQFLIVKWVGIRILNVKLTGGTKSVMAQPAVICTDTAITGPSTTVSDYVFTKPRLVP